MEKELSTILKGAVSSSVESCRALAELILDLHSDPQVEGSSLTKFMAVCESLRLQELVPLN